MDDRGGYFRERFPLPVLKMTQSIFFQSPAAFSIERVKVMFTVREWGRNSSEGAAIEMGYCPDIAVHCPDCTGGIAANRIYIPICETITRVPKPPLGRIRGVHDRGSEDKKRKQLWQCA